MSTLAASNADEPPSSPSLFSSLPLDLVLNVLARVPKQYYPIVSCVSKNLRSLVRSPELYKTRSLLGKDSLFICFFDKSNLFSSRRWYTLRRIENNPTANRFASARFPNTFEPCQYSIIAVGPEIFFIGGSSNPSSSLWILDPRSKELRRGPSMPVNRDRLNTTVGLVGGKIYVIGGYRGDQIRADVFDLKTQTWEPAPIPEGNHAWHTTANVSLDRKVHALSFNRGMACYDTRDGSCEILELPNDNWWKAGVCVIDNVLYVYFSRFGLMWYDSELMLWRVVYGLDLGKARSVGMGEYYGKLAFLWKGAVTGETKEIRCTMIVLHRSEEGIHGTAEPSQRLGIVPRRYYLEHCLSLSG